MLEKNEKNVVFDAHFHISECNLRENPEEFWKFCEEKGLSYKGISSSWNQEQFFLQKKLIEKANSHKGVEIIPSFGIHPWYPQESLSFFEELLKTDQIQVAGEMGLDLFTPELKSTLKLQEQVFSSQLELCVQYDKPAVIHLRKGFDSLQKYIPLLRKLPEVLFHSFSGPAVQAQFILNKGINAYFSFGKQLLNGNKNAGDCVRNLPHERIHSETDAPFQFLKNEDFTCLKDILIVRDYILTVQKQACN